MASGMPPADSSRIIVAEDAGKIIGFQMLIFVPHLEPIWVDPAYRGGWVPFRLFQRTKQLLDQFRISVAYLFSKTPEVADYLQRLGLTKLPYETYLYDPKGTYKD